MDDFSVKSSQVLGNIFDFAVSLVVITLSLVTCNVTTNLALFDENQTVEVSMTAVDATCAFLSTIALHIAEWLSDPHQESVNLGQVLRLPWLMVTANGLLANETPTLYKIGRSLLSWKTVPAIALICSSTAVYVEQILFWLQNMKKLLRLRPESRLFSAWWTNDKRKLPELAD